jgi:LPXTG-motif cell wall-anchored protein
VDQDPVDQDPVDQDPVDQDPVDQDPVDQDPVDQAEPKGEQQEAPAVQPASASAGIAPAATVLPNTGGAHSLPVALGLALVMAGGLMAQRGLRGLR